MNKQDVLKTIELIAAQMLNFSEKEILTNSKIVDLAEWDSMRHVQIIDAVEKAFDIQFDLLEIVEFDSITDIADAIIRISDEI